MLYGGIILWLNIQRVVDGPYPFMKVYDQSVQASVLWCIAILLMNYFYAWLLWKLNGGKGGKKRKKPDDLKCPPLRSGHL